ncbi:MAG: glycosyltransferase family 1 protein [Oleibacter sp.]|nr:glycosyltransferase family 1 protein [Thalassolituus sp.]
MNQRICRHLCIVSETYVPDVNGVANSLHRLVQHLNPKEFRVTIVRPSPRTNPNFASNETSTEKYIPVYPELITRGFPIPQYPEMQIGLPAGGRINKCWHQDPPDIVYIATEGPLGMSALRCAKALKLPVISAFHTNFHHYSGYYGMAWITRALMCWMRYFHNRTDRTLVPSNDVRTELTQRGFRNVDWLPHGVDCDVFNPRWRCSVLRQSWGIPDAQQLSINPSLPTPSVLLFVGRVAAEKNLLLAIESWEKLVAAGKKVKLVVVGDGPLLATLQAKYPEIIFAGRRTGLELSKYFASADAFLMPSLTETFGLVTLEAMASGLPVVAFNQAAAAQYVRQGIDGYLCPTPSLAEKSSAVSTDVSNTFHGSVCRLLENDLTLMGIDARAQAEKASWHTVARRFEHCCNELIEERMIAPHSAATTLSESLSESFSET